MKPATGYYSYTKRYCDTKSLYIIGLQGLRPCKPIVLPIVSYRDNGCMVQPLSVEAPGRSVPNAGIAYPMVRPASCEADFTHTHERNYGVF
jgi:hypothetical protein